MKIKTSIILIVSTITQPALAYVTSGLPGHVHRAWLKQMTIEVCDTAPGQLSQEMCNKAPQLLSAWAQNPYVPHTKSKACSETYPHHGKECAIFCEKLLKRLIDERRAGNPNAIASTQTYNSLIDVWSRSGEKGAAAQRAEDIVIGMQDAYSLGEKDVQPDLESFRLVLKAWSQAHGEEYAPHRAQRLLEWMVNLHQSGQNDLVEPDSDCFNIVLNSWANSNHIDAPRKAENMIMYMDKLYNNGNADAKPNRDNFNYVLKAWSKSENLIDAATRAEDILNFMLFLSKQEGEDDLTPNITTYSSVISAWARSKHQDSGRKADGVLKKLERESKVSRDPELTSNTILYNLVIDAHAKSPSNKAHTRARAVLDRQIRLYKDGNNECKPDVYSFTSVLSSCASLTGTASKKEKQQAFDIAMSTFYEMSRFNLAPNHVTYGMMLKACSRLLPLGRERRNVTRNFFRMACKDGCVGEMVLNRLEDAASSAQYKGLMKNITKDQLPEEWTKNLPASDFHSRKYKKNNNSAKRKMSKQK
ncbi:hypothetical protein CTEN210_08707 [Chaetoceros tenuissimus]|uniref:Uncharacterized protein n=1 Tax=Chaetoceros tenuissimus TaxID=426638 RepID=A0AAD3H6N5_9STRA|nr:hypothetical protein CTEN210_08707 [Chaetoceros tenuissimus]